MDQRANSQSIKRSKRAGPGRKALLAGLALALSAVGCGRKATPPAIAQVGDVEEGWASWYGRPYHGRRTANGEVYDMEAATAAHRTLPFDTWVQVRNLVNGRVTTVRINDRGPFVKDRIIDLSRKAAEEIDMLRSGTARVRIAVVDPSAVDGGVFYAVQVGAFRDEDNARRLQALLTANFSKVSVQRSGGLYRVRVGRLRSYAEARKLADRLRREPSVRDAVVVRLR